MNSKQQDKRTILNFLQKNVLSTISTVNPQKNQPESALVAYAELPNLELIFTTLQGSRKYENLLKNNKVALVVGWDPRPQYWATLQYEGIATRIPEKEVAHYKKIFSMKKDTPCSEEFLSKPEMKLFKIIPTWIGFSDFTGNNPKVIELKSFKR